MYMDGAVQDIEDGDLETPLDTYFILLSNHGQHGVKKNDPRFAELQLRLARLLALRAAKIAPKACRAEVASLEKAAGRAADSVAATIRTD
jgi:hypothetical protein